MLVSCTIEHPDRLMRMVSLLERDAANPEGVQFNMDTWVAPSKSIRPNNCYTIKNEPIKADCGTMACAFGLAVISGEFAKEGLTYKFDEVAGYHDGSADYYLIPTMPNGEKEEVGFGAAGHLFGIPYEVVEYMFDPSQYLDTPKGAEGEMLVAHRIREFVLSGGTYDDGRGEGDLDDSD